MKRIKFKTVFLVSAFIFLFSACFVYSFYPLYTDDDLFPNDLLLGEWMDQDSTIWKFEHKRTPKFSHRGISNVDSTTYYLKIRDYDEEGFGDESISVRIVKLEEYYFIDFYLDDYPEHSAESKFGVYLIPAHVFAKLELNGNNTTIKYFNPDWLGRLIRENKIRIHHEKTEDRVLLTAKPKELQKFVLKYVNSEEAFEEDYTVNLMKQ